MYVSVINNPNIVIKLNVTIGAEDWLRGQWENKVFYCICGKYLLEKRQCSRRFCHGGSCLSDNLFIPLLWLRACWCILLCML